MLVRDFIEALQKMPQDMPVAFDVYNNQYGAMHQVSHGPLQFVLGSANGIPASLFIGPMLSYEIETGRISGEVVFTAERVPWRECVKDPNDPWKPYEK